MEQDQCWYQMLIKPSIIFLCYRRLTVNTGGSASGTVTIKPPASSESGTDATLTILAQGPVAADSNYAVRRLSVLAEVTWWYLLP